MKPCPALVLSFVVLLPALSACAPPASSLPGPVSPAPTDATPAEPSVAITPDMGSPHVGDIAPDFELSDQEGKTIKLSSLRGSVVMLAFVTSWCPFSEAEQPHLRKLADDYTGKNVRVIAVDIKENDQGYAKYLDRVKMPFPVLRDRTGEVVAKFTPDRAQPAIRDRSTVLVTSNIVLDREGRIAFFTMVDTLHFDSRLVHARRAIDRELARSEAN